MQIIVASANIFRRELSVYVLSEAGHQVTEVLDVPSLLNLASLSSTQIVLIDVLLAGGDIPALRRQLGAPGQPPILWLAQGIGSSAERDSVLPDGWLSWPYSPDDLLHEIDRLLAAPGSSDIFFPALKQRYAGDRR